MLSNKTISRSFERKKVIGPLHTGGPVALASDGQHVITCVGEEALLTRLGDGTELCRFLAVRKYFLYLKDMLY